MPALRLAQCAALTAYSGPERQPDRTFPRASWNQATIRPCANGTSLSKPMGEFRLADEFILETHGLTKEFAGFFAVRDVNLQVRRGSIHALIGPNGAGKTTCFNLLTKFLKPSAGQILYKGQDITAMAPADVARLGLVRSFQISAVFPHLTALENVRVALQRQHGQSFDFWRSKSVLDRFNNRAHELLNDVGLSEFASTPAVEMPYGRKRALEIATTLALDPEMMLLHGQGAGDGLDEPVDDHAHGLLLRETPAHQVEELVVAHLGDGGLVADASVLLGDLHVGRGVGAAVLVEDEGVAAHVALHPVGTLLDLHQASVRRTPAVLGDRLR